MTPYQNFGLHGEDCFAVVLEESGMVARFPDYRLHKGEDLVAIDVFGEVIPIHVKVGRFSHRRMGGRWRYVCQFRLSNIVDDGGYVAVGARWEGRFVWFLIPCREVANRKSLYFYSSPYDYRGWASRYRVGDGVRVDAILAS